MKKDYPDKINEFEENSLKHLGENDPKLLKTGVPDKWKFLTKKLAYPYESFKSIKDYQKPVDKLKEEDFFGKLKNDYPSDEEIQRPMDIIKRFNIKIGEELTQIDLENNLLLLACVFEKFIKVSVHNFDTDPLYFVSLPGYTRQCGLKSTGVNLQTLQGEDMILLLGNNIRGGISSVMGNRYTKSDENKNILLAEANNLYGHFESQPLFYDETKFDKKIKLEDNLNTPDDSDVGYFVEVDLIYADNIEQSKKIPICSCQINPHDFKDCMKLVKPDTYTQTKKLICDWSDRKNYLVHYKMLRFYVKHGMVVDKVYEIISFQQSKWLEKNINFNTQKRNEAVNDFEKVFYSLLINAFYGKSFKNVRSRLKIEFNKKGRV